MNLTHPHGRTLAGVQAGSVSASRLCKRDDWQACGGAARRPGCTQFGLTFARALPC